ncbi:hypothetical protein Ddc_10350 [Ditylenchus destructor]|nr:hypothetical protein Ddc_10350 [Ditylenchus destructor]
MSNVADRILLVLSKNQQGIPQQISSMNAIPYALLMDELEKQPKAITVEIERLEESYRALRTLQIQCKDRYVGLENQIKTAGSNLQLQISGHQTTIAPSQRHPRNVHSLNQTLQDLQDLRPDFNVASSDLSDVTAKVNALLRKLNAMKETMGLEPEKSAEERVIDDLDKKKRFHQGIVKRLYITNLLAFTSLYVATLLTSFIVLARVYENAKKKLSLRSNDQLMSVPELCFIIIVVSSLAFLGEYISKKMMYHKDTIRVIDEQIADSMIFLESKPV